MNLEIHKAGWIIADPDHIIENGCLVIENGLIADIRRPKTGDGRNTTDHGPGVILPAFVNAHTHLELSALAGLVPCEGGFRKWVTHLLQKRTEMGSERLIQAAETGAEAIKQSGCGAVGDISTTGISFAPLLRSGLSGVWFREYIGHAECGGIDPVPEDGRIAASAAGHGPHTTHPETLQAVKQLSKSAGLPFSVHLAESGDETEFLTTGKGLWADFLTERGIHFSDWDIPVRSPVEYADRLGLLDNRTIAAHLLNIDATDMQILQKRKIHVCLCPRSNMYLHGETPDIPEFIRAGLNVCLGTDSPASAPTTSIIDEARFVAKLFPDIPPKTIFAMITVNGATALHLKSAPGMLHKGKTGVFAYMDTSAGHKQTVFENIIYHEDSGDGPARLMIPGLNKNDGPS